MKQNFKFSYQIRVRFAETDMQGFVFNGNYLTYYDVAWTEYFRALGVTYDDLRREGVDTVLARAILEFKSPARFDELLEIYARVSRVGTTSIVFDFEVYKSGGEQFIASASSIYVFISLETNQPVLVPDKLRLSLCRFEGRDLSEVSSRDFGTVT